ncbi:MAG: imelysin family protein [Polyangiaceae bacterium]|nr:imelysin family protein [Polyangiaceae bacterium]
MNPSAPPSRGASTPPPPRPAATRPRWAAACWAGAVLGALAASTCRMPTPDEVVYTGAVATNPTPTTPPTVPPPPLPTNTAGAAGAGGAAGAAGSVPFTKPALLAAIAECTFGRYRDFEASAVALRDVTAEHASGPTEERAGRVRQAWLAATALWQEAEPFRFGPAASAIEPGGRDLRAQIYSWPEISRCKVEEQIVNQAYADPGFPVTTLVNGRGLFSLEYLSFFGGTNNACSQFSVINAPDNPQNWASLSPDELVLRKAAYGAASAADVLARASELVAEWGPEGAFRAQFVGAGAGSTVYPGEQNALNAVSNAMFYVDQEVKDFKVGRPVGYYECSAATCPELVEARFSRNSVNNIRSNLRGFARLFNGCGAGDTGLGFDDWLGAVGADDLAGRMRAALAGAEATAAAIELPIDEALAADPAKVAALHASIKTLTDLLKTEFITVLNLELPRSAEGDND